MNAKLAFAFALACLLAAISVNAQTSIGFCYITYSNYNVPGYVTWSSVTQGVMQVTASATAGVYTVNSVTGYRNISSLDGLGRTLVTSPITLGNIGSCAGCNNLLYYPATSTGFFDQYGVQMYTLNSIVDGSNCNGTTVTLKTSNTSTCGNGITIATSSASLNVYAIGSSPVPACVPNALVIPSFNCAIGPYNFNSLATSPDLHYYDVTSGYTIFMRLCGAVSQSDCVNSFGNNNQVCQWTSSTNLYELASTHAPNGELNFTYSNGVDASAGIAYNISDGQYCGANPRRVTGIITCGAGNAITYYKEVASCVYMILINSPLACSSSVAPLITTSQYKFCHTTFSSTLFTEVGSYSQWAAVTSGTFTVNSTNANGAYQVISVSGYRLASMSDGSGRVASNATISLLPSIGSTSTCVGLCDNVLYYPSTTGYTDGSGIGIQMSLNQSDSNLCVGTSVSWKQNNMAYCPIGVSRNSLNTFVVVPATSSISCPIPSLNIPPAYTCGIGNYNFSSLATSNDLAYVQSSGTIIYVRLCGSVAQSDCVRNFGQNAMMCQFQSSTSLYEIASTNAPSGAITFSYANGVDGTNGINFTSADGQSCSSTLTRSAYGTILCGATNSILYFNEVSTCNYYFRMTSPLACPTPVTATSQFSFCQVTYFADNGADGNTLEWASITSGIITASPSPVSGTYNVISVSGYRATASDDGFGTVTSNVTIGLLNPGSCAGSCSNLLYSPSLSNLASFDYGGLGLSLSASQTDGTGCTGSRVTIALNNSICGVGSSGAAHNSLRLQAYTGAAPVCTPQSLTVPRTYCGIGPYNFTSLSTAGDVAGVFSGYTIYMRLCGSVAQQDCVNSFGHNVQFCQWGSSTNLYELAASHSPAGQLSFSYANGVDGSAGISYSIQDGQICPSGVIRAVSGLISCGTTTAITSYNEVSSCNYNIAITSPLACPVQTYMFSFCAVEASSNFVNYQNFYTISSGIMNVSTTSVAGRFLVNNLINAYVNSSDGLTSLALSMIGVNGFGANDNVLIYRAGTAYATTNPDAGIAWQYSRGSSVYQTRFYLSSVYNRMASTGGQGNNMSVTILPYYSGATMVTCRPPVLKTSSLALNTVQQFAFCFITYSQSVMMEYLSSAVWASVTSGVITGSSQTNDGVFTVTGITGVRNISTFDGLGKVLSTVSISTTSIGGGSTLYYNSALVLPNVYTDSNGLAYSLSSNQTDNAGCSGNYIRIFGTTEVCTNTQFPIDSYENSLVMAPYSSTAPLTCTAPVLNIPSYYCGIGTYNFTSLAYGPDLTLSSGGYNIIVRLCGAVSNSICVGRFAGNTMMCQNGASAANTYELAATNSPVGEISFSYTNGVDGTNGISFYIADGQNCNSNVLHPRFVNGTISCGTANAVTSYSEPSTCNYLIGMTSPLACTSSTTISQFSFCLVTYDTVGYWASYASGIMNIATTNNVNYNLLSVNGSRWVALSDETGRPATPPSTVSLQALSATAINPTTAPYIGSTGFTLALSASQTDIAGCSASSISVAWNSTSSSYGAGCTGSGIQVNSQNSLVLTPTSNNVVFSCVPRLPVNIPYYCGIGPYNLTSLAYGPDLTYVSGGYWNVVVRLCGAVSNYGCTSNYGNNTMVCQNAPTTGESFEMALTNAPIAPVFSYYNGVDASAGIMMTVTDGQLCGTSLQPRGVSVLITCGAVNSVTSYAEPSTCQYAIGMTSPLVCTGGGFVSTQSTFSFCYTTYDDDVPGYLYWSSITRGVIVANSTAQGVYKIISVNGYRLAATTDATGSVASNVTIKNIEPLATCIGGCSNALYYPSTATGNFDGAGLALRLSANQTDGSGGTACSGDEIVFRSGNTTLCAVGSNTHASNSFVIQPYSASSPLSCPVPTLNYQTPTCGIGSYSFSSLANSDLNVTMNGYTIYMRLCGAVSQPDCVKSFGQNSQVCQWASSSAQYEIAAFRSVTGVNQWNYANGVDGTKGITFSSHDGQYCGATPRTVNGIITCGATTSLNYYQELSVQCTYQLNLTSPLACNGGQPPVSSSSTGPSGVSLGCSYSGSVPSGSIAVSLVLQASVANLQSIQSFGSKFMTAILNTLGLTDTNLIACRSVQDSNGVTYNANPSSGQTKVNFYLLNSDAHPASSLFASLQSSPNLGANLLNSLQYTYVAGTLSNDGTTSSGGSGLSGGAIAGIVIGVIIGVCILLLAVFFMMRRSGKSAQYTSKSTTDQDANATHKYAQHEASTADQSTNQHEEVEMAETGDTSEDAHEGTETM